MMTIMMMMRWSISSVQFSSVAQSCLTLCNPIDCSTPGIPVHHQLPEFTQTHARWLSDTIQPSHPLSSPSPPTFNLSQPQCLFKWLSSLHQVAKYWSYSFSISPSNEYSWMISFRMNWLNLLAVQRTLKNLLQHHSSKVFRSNTTVQKYSDVITGNNCLTEEIENIFSYLFIDHPFTTKHHVLNGSGGSCDGITAFYIKKKVRYYS